MREAWYGRIAADDRGCHDAGYPPNKGMKLTRPVQVAGLADYPRCWADSYGMELRMWRELVSALFDDAEFNEPASEADIAQLEKAFNLRLPQELKEFLLECNGVEADYVPLVWSVEEMIAENQSFRGNREFAELCMPFDCLLFFGGEGGGDQFAYRVLAGQFRRTSETCGAPPNKPMNLSIRKRVSGGPAARAIGINSRLAGYGPC